MILAPELSRDRITVGVATCGISAGAKEVLDELKKYSLFIPIMETGCVGMCYNEPIVTVYRDGKKTIYGNVQKEDVKELVKCIKDRKVFDKKFICEDLEELPFYKKQKRIVMKNCGFIQPLNLDQYISQDGFHGLKNAIELLPEKVIDEIDFAGLRGRGGAGFPTATKWRFISKKTGDKIVVCNGDEGDPGAFMNRTLMESDPFKIIEGMLIGAWATGAKEGIIYTREEYPLAIETLETAIKICRENRLLGKNILSKNGFDFDLTIRRGAGAYVCGEETALIKSIQGERGQPMPRPPFPADKGVYGKPTVVNNVGTWGHVATIMQMGSKNYKKIGSKFTRGTKILCLSGDVKRTGVIEVPFGIKLKEIIYDIGGGAPNNKKIKALFPGGPAGGCVVPKDFESSLDYESMTKLNTIMGSGSFIVVDETNCMVDRAKYFLNFTQQESCGKCVPCREGTKRLLEMLQKISKGNGVVQDIDKLNELAVYVSKNSLCGLGQFAPNPVLSTIKHFRKEYEEHLVEKICPAGVCENLVQYIIKVNCIGCGACKRNCPVGAITGDPKERHYIDQSKCIKCGKCYEVCAFDAIEKK
ncbi:MAG: NADH-ubiquinone oxidoreductase-F iron-sulfur binding region domain-containing protein [Candidatus Nanoarchaeia archaeon]|nr:NADH-ubiquinone oxidoreductase-F iron-sulfur binding region domain-containing protein [Candidatus Nanoarchaeia archaeon]